MSKTQIIRASRDDESDLKAYLKILRRRLNIVFPVAGAIFFLAVILTYTTPPTFTAASQVLLERNHGKSGLESTYSYYEPDFLDTQAEIIKSENVAKKVVKNLLLATTYRHYFLGEKESEQSGGIKARIKETLRTIKLFFSDSVSTTEKNQPAQIMFKPRSEEQIIADIVRGGLSVTPLKNTKIVTISYKNRDPAIAKLVVDGVVKAYQDEMLDIKLSTSSYSLKWMTSKAAEERDKLEKSERELQQFMRANDLVTVENRLAVLPQKLSEFGSQLTKAQTEKKDLQDLLKQIEDTGKKAELLERIPLFASDGGLKNIRERIYKANQTIQELSKKYGVKHPVMIRAKDELRILRDERRFEINRIVSTVENSYELANSKVKSLLGLLEETKQEMLNLNEKFMQYSIMKREVESNRVLYDTLQTSIKQQGVTEQSQSVNIWVIKRASLPVHPSSPRKKLNIIVGLVFGVLLGIMIAFFVDYLDNTISNVRQVEERFDLTVLGSVQELQSKEQSIDSYILYNPLSPFAESYRLIRSALLLSSADHPPRAILVTSMNKSEGKTVTITNLARMLVQGKKSVAIIDCDLRRPRMHSLLQVSNEEGLSSYLAGTSTEIHIAEIPDELISLIPSGPIPPDPSELLGSGKMKQLIDDLLLRFDFVLLDSPPIGAVTDSLTLSQYVDGTILVIRAGFTTIDMFESGVKKMEDINGRLLGVVLNRVKMQEQNAYQYGYTTYYAKDDD